jgi:hypothetical protein
MTSNDRSTYVIRLRPNPDPNIIDGLAQAARDQGATLPQAPEPLIVWSPMPWPDDRTVLGFSVDDMTRLPRILEAMRART